MAPSLMRIPPVEAPTAGAAGITGKGEEIIVDRSTVVKSTVKY
jgi:hypothetical protein